MKCPYCGDRLFYSAEPFGLQKVVVVSCRKLNCPHSYIVHVAFAFRLKRAVKKAEKNLLKSYEISKKVELFNMEAMNDLSTSDKEKEQDDE